MAKVVTASLKNSGARRRSRIETRVVRTEDGGRETVRILDSRGDRFGADLNAVFRRNVRKARSENKRVTGRADFVPAET